MLQHYSDLVRHFWKVILGGAIGAGALAFALSALLLSAMPFYTATVTLNMQPSEEALMFNSGFMGVSQFNPATIITQTHIERLLSRKVAERALDILIAESAGGLPADPPNAFDRFRAALWRNWNILNYGYFTPLSEREVQVNDLMNAIEVELVEGSYIMLIEVTHDNPEIAARAANALTRAYIEQSSADFATDAAEVDKAIAALQSEKATQLAGYLEQRRALARDLGARSMDNERDMLIATRIEATQALKDAEIALAEQTARDQSGEGDAALLASAARRAELQAGALRTAEDRLAALDRAEIETAEIDQRIKESETDLAELQARKVRTELARKARMSQVRIISDARAPIYPTFPKVFLNTAIGTILGAVLAMAPIMVLDSLDNRVRTVEDLRQGAGGRALPTISGRLVRQARRFLSEGGTAGPLLRAFAGTLGRRFVTEGRRSWPERRIYVTAFGEPEDVARLRDTVEAAVRLAVPASPERPGLEVIALPEVGRLRDWTRYADGHMIVGVRSGAADREEAARAGLGENPATAPFLTVLL